MDAILFDMDGTLLDTEKYYQRTWRQAAADCGYELSAEETLKLRSLGRPFVFAQFQEWFGSEAVYRTVLERRRELMDAIIKKEGIPLKAGAVQALQELKTLGIRTAVVTATNRERADAYLKEAGLFPFFEEIVCASMVQRGKPAPDVYQYACTQMQITPEKTIAVEDSPNGVRSAAAAGCQVVMVPDLTLPDPDTRKLLWREISCLDALPALVSDSKRR